MSVERLRPDLALGGNDLAVFVAGPGLGEGVAVALPGGGWLLIDGCRAGGAVGDDAPLLAIWKTWRRDAGDSVKWVILTHPHGDHVAGFAEVVDAVNPENIGMAGPPAPGRGLYAELAGWLVQQAPTEESLARDQLLAAANAIRTWERQSRREVTPLHDGVGLVDGAAHVRALSPDPGFAEQLAAQTWPAFRSQANLLSIVLEVVFGGTRVLLTGDLPHRVANTVHPHGWQRLAAVHPGVLPPGGLKVPHHGSKDALHPTLTRGAPPRGMWVTPYSRGQAPLPRWADGEGLSRLLQVDDVKLTAPPRRPPPGQIRPGDVLTRAELGTWLTAPPTMGFLADAEDISLPDTPSALSPVWLCVYNDQGEVVREERGDAAILLTREDPA